MLMKTVLLFLVCSVIASVPFHCVYAREMPNVVPVPTNSYPALLFSEEDLKAEPRSRTTLKMATFFDSEVKLQEIMAAQYIQAEQLNDSVFLLEASHHSSQNDAQWSNAYYLVDFNTGENVSLFESTGRDQLVHLRCLYSAPDKGEAVLFRYGQGAKQNSLIRVDLGSLETSVLRNMPREIPPKGFYRYEISPDYKRLACMVRKGGHPSQVYSLQVLDLDTLKTTELDDCVRVEVGMESSMRGIPPFEWISPTNILYQHMLMDENSSKEWCGPRNADYILKCVNIETGTTNEWKRKRMPLTMDGGSMRRDWLTNALGYNGFLVDTQLRTLEESKKLLTPGSHLLRSLSPSGKHLAWLMPRQVDAAASLLFIKTQGVEYKIEIKSRYCAVLTWMEDTTLLRKEAE